MTLLLPLSKTGKQYALHEKTASLAIKVDTDVDMDVAVEAIVTEVLLSVVLTEIPLTGPIANTSI